MVVKGAFEGDEGLFKAHAPNDKWRRAA
jgi:hypothetical protein